jgi:hypothetical protein
MKKIFACSLLLALVTSVVPAASVGAETKMTVLGEDPAGDGPPALDVTYLAVGKAGKALEIHIGVDGMLPAIGGYPQLPGIQWAFDIKSRTFVAEAYVDNQNPRFLLFELDENGGFTQLGELEGTYDSADGFIRMLVPLKDVGAKKGTKVSGMGPKGTEDVDAHIHVGPVTEITDAFATERDYKIP